VAAILDLALLSHYFARPQNMGVTGEICFMHITSIGVLPVLRPPFDSTSNLHSRQVTLYICVWNASKSCSLLYPFKRRKRWGICYCTFRSNGISPVRAEHAVILIETTRDNIMIRITRPAGDRHWTQLYSDTNHNRWRTLDTRAQDKQTCSTIKQETANRIDIVEELSWLFYRRVPRRICLQYTSSMQVTVYRPHTTSVFQCVPVELLSKIKC